MTRSQQPRGVADAPTLFDLTDKPAAATTHGAEGHRGRMRERLLTAGGDALADHEMLEMVLFLALPRRDTKPIARDILKRFGGFGPAIAASRGELLEVEGLGDAGAAALKLVQAAALRLMRASVLGQHVLAGWDDLIAYLTATLGHEKTEQFRIIFLDSRNRVLGDEVLGQGTVNHAPVYPREIVRRALALHATALVLVHNHPSGDPTPSRDDVAMTRLIAQAGEALGITIHDHIVIGAGRWVSFRSEGLL